MSFLRDRLKQIAEETKNQVHEEAAVPQCSQVKTFMPLDPLALTREGLEYMSGSPDVARAYQGPESLAFIDVETTGLSRGAGTIAFEVGMGRIQGGGMHITQLYMREYDQEEDMLRQIGHLLAGATLLVSFNGKSFDLPLLEGRCVMNRIPPTWTRLPNLDLLHPARRLYKIRLKQCNLTTLEERILNHTRTDDIPGAQIPGIWMEFLKTGNDHDMQKVLHHNLLDVHSMGRLLSAIHDAHIHPAEQMHIEDVFSMGKVMERVGRIEIAEQCYIVAESGAMRGASGQALSRIYRRSGRIEENIAHLKHMTNTSGNDVFACVELAKIYEHKYKNYDCALFYTETALTRSALASEIEPLKKRRARLVRLQAKQRSHQ